MSLVKMNDSELLANAKRLASDERRVQVEILWHLLEIQKRKLFLNLGYPSLFEYAIKDLGYSASAAYRRIQAMRLLQSVPDVAEKLETGTINLTTASQVQTFIKAEKKAGTEISYRQKVEMLKAVENKSTREVEKHIITLKPEQAFAQEKVRFVTPEIVELKIMIPDFLKEKLDHLKYYLSHRNPEMTYLRLIEYLAERALLKIEQRTKRAVAAVVSGPANPIPPRRNIPATLRHAVWLRDGGVCSYHDPKTGKRCGGRYQVQVDHIHPYSQGGDHALENLQLLCAQHNRFKGSRLQARYARVGRDDSITK